MSRKSKTAHAQSDEWKVKHQGPRKDYLRKVLRTITRQAGKVAPKAILGAWFFLQGCALFSPDPVIRHPDGPALITDTAGGRVRLAAWDRQTGRLRDVGWGDISEFRGWTLHKFDWEEYLTDMGKKESR